MDFARKIGKSEKPQIWKKTRQPLVTSRDNLLSEDKPFSEDRRLINWKKWLADRKQQTRRIESVTGRSQADQLQNSSERFRAFVEMKNLMEHAALPVITDKCYDGPEFWRTLEFLPKHGDACLPEVFLTPSKKDLNLRPDLMHIGLPDLIARERDFVVQKTKEEFWKSSEYLKTRKLELTEKIALLLPKEPETATLAIQGHAFKDKKKKPLLRIPPITITEPDENEALENADQAAVLKIQDREFVWQRSLVGKTELVDSKPVMWSLTFMGKIEERVEKEIVFENKGTHVIAYYWRYSPFRTYGVSFERRGSPFFFNKTKGLILPGQIVKMKVWYRSRIHGVFTEFWRLVTEPKLSSSTFIFRLWGCTTDVQSEKLTDYRTIDEYLNRCIRDSTIRSIIEEIIAGVEHHQPPEPPYEMSQSDLFVSLNPFYHYHPSIVMQLEKMYFDVTDESMPAWNLSLDTLRDILLQIKNTNYKRDMLARFNKLCKQSLRPRLYEFDVACYNKYDAVYNILCAFANQFENESELIKRNSLIQEESAMLIEAEQTLTPLSRKSNNSPQEIHSKKLNAQLETPLVQNEKESFTLNLRPYREIFFIRIYKALEEAIEKVCSSIDSFHRLNELKFKI